LQENFIQDPVESADVVSETVALEDTVLPQEDTSLDSLLNDIPKVEEPPILEVKEKEIPKFELEKEEFIPIDGPLGLIKPLKTNSTKTPPPDKFQTRAVKENVELRAFEVATDAVVSSNTMYQLGVAGNNVSELLENNLQPELRAYVKDLYKKSNPELDLPNDVRIDKMVANKLEKIRIKEVEEFYKEDNKRRTNIKKGDFTMTR